MRGSLMGKSGNVNKKSKLESEFRDFLTFFIHLFIRKVSSTNEVNDSFIFKIAFVLKVGNNWIRL